MTKERKILDIIEKMAIRFEKIFEELDNFEDYHDYDSHALRGIIVHLIWDYYEAIDWVDKDIYEIKQIIEGKK